MTTNMNTGAASLSDEQRTTIQHAADKLRTVWANHTGDKESRELCHKLEALLATPTPQADAAPTFEAWATKEGLISESHGVRFVNSMCDVARKAWDAAIAAGGAQEPIYQQQYCGEGVWRDMPKDKWDEKQAGILASDQRFRIVYAAPLPRVAATVALTDGWISVDERLPECRTECTSSGTDVSNTVYLLGDSIGGSLGYGIGHLQSDGKWVCYDGEHDFMCITCVTHWMPLPAAPAESNGAPK